MIQFLSHRAAGGEGGRSGHQAMRLDGSEHGKRPLVVFTADRDSVVRRRYSLSFDESKGDDARALSESPVSRKRILLARSRRTRILAKADLSAARSLNTHGRAFVAIAPRTSDRQKIDKDGGEERIRIRPEALADHDFQWRRKRPIHKGIDHFLSPPNRTTAVRNSLQWLKRSLFED